MVENAGEGCSSMENPLYCGVGGKSKALRTCSRGGTAEAMLNLCGTRIDINGKKVDGEGDTARFRKEQAWAVEKGQDERW